jgi:hypothetical protein
MVLPSLDGEGYVGHLLTPAGVGSDAAARLANDVLGRFERMEEADPSKEWQFADLAKELEAMGFLKLNVVTGPTWDRKG